jgi:hypothetical protein
MGVQKMSGREKMEKCINVRKDQLLLMQQTGNEKNEKDSEKRCIEIQYYAYKCIQNYYKNIHKKDRTAEEHKIVRKSCYYVARLRDLYPELEFLKDGTVQGAKQIHKANIKVKGETNKNGQIKEKREYSTAKNNVNAINLTSYDEKNKASETKTNNCNAIKGSSLSEKKENCKMEEKDIYQKGRIYGKKKIFENQQYPNGIFSFNMFEVLIDHPTNEVDNSTVAIKEATGADESMNLFHKSPNGEQTDLDGKTENVIFKKTYEDQKVKEIITNRSYNFQLEALMFMARQEMKRTKKINKRDRLCENKSLTENFIVLSDRAVSESCRSPEQYSKAKTKVCTINRC